MSSNIINQVAFLRTTRQFPTEPIELTEEIDRAYVDISNAVNNRTIGIFPTTRAAQGGESWFVSGNKRQQSFRQVYNITPGAAPILIPHGLNLQAIYAFTRIFGSFTDGTNWYPLPYVNVIAANNQVNVRVDSTYIIINSGAGAPPTISSGMVVLEWISDP